MITLAARPDPVRLSLEQSALVVVDMQNAFASKGGMLDIAGHDISKAAEIVAVKRGAKGATIVGQGERFDFKGHIVEEVDPTGAGDCFCGTFVSLISQGVSLFDAGQLANAAGAIAVTRRGPMEGNSSPAEIARFLGVAIPKEINA